MSSGNVSSSSFVLAPPATLVVLADAASSIRPDPNLPYFLTLASELGSVIDWSGCLSLVPSKERRKLEIEAEQKAQADERAEIIKQCLEANPLVPPVGCPSRSRGSS
jgi:hypothetical protein